MTYAPVRNIAFPAASGPLACYNFNGTAVHAMATLNTGYAARFIATTTKDIKSVCVPWYAVSSPGEVTVRIETVDATTGKPTGTLYDANATKAFTPATGGWQTITFDTLPTTGLTIGTPYCVVFLTTTGGTTQTIYSGETVGGGWPIGALFAADGTTRGNFAESSVMTAPAMTFVLDDDSLETFGFSAFYTEGTARNIYGATHMAGVYLVTPFDCTVRGVQWQASLGKYNTPAGDIRVRILNLSNVQITNATATIDKDYIQNTTGRYGIAWFNVAVTLPAGTYRVVFDSASTVDGGNCWYLRSINLQTGHASALWQPTYTSDGGTNWTEPSGFTDMSLVLEGITEGSGGSDFPAITDVRNAVSYNDGALVGTCYVPIAANTIEGVDVDDTVGTYHEAAADEVAEGVNFGPASAYTGTLVTTNPLTVTDVQQLRYRLGLDGTTDTPSATVALGTIPVNMTQIGGVTVTSSGGRPEVNMVRINGDTVATSTYPDVNIAQMGGQTVTAAAGVTVGAYVGQTTAILAADASGNVNANMTEIGGQAVTCAAPVTVGVYVGHAKDFLIDDDGYVYTNVKWINDEAVTVQAGVSLVTFGSFVGNETAVLAVNASGHVTPADGSLTTSKLGSPFVLAKTTNITGFNDIAATSVVSNGAITTAAGAVSSVTTVGTTNALAADSISSSALSSMAVLEIANALTALLATKTFQKNTEVADFKFWMLDSADHVTPKTGRTVTAQRCIDDGSFAACANAVTEIAYGAYKITLAAADTNGDCILYRFTAEGADARLIAVLTQS